MSGIQLKDANDQGFKPDVFVRQESGEDVVMQAIVPVDPASGAPLDLATQATLAELAAAVGALNAVAGAIKSAVESLNLKTTAVNTGAVSGVVALDASTLVALESINANTGLVQALTDSQLRAAAIPVSGAVALDAPTLAALETINIGNLPETQPVSVSGLPLPTGAATEATAALTIKQKNAVASLADYGYLMLAQRRDADTAETTADGQYTALKQDEAGRLKVATQPASNAAVAGSIIANGGIVSIPCGRFGNLSVSMIATSLVGHNVSFECSNNSTNGTDGAWYGVQAVRSNANTCETTTGVLAATPVYMWHVNVGDYLYFRVRATAHTSGTAAYILKPGSYATEPIPAVQITGTQPVSFTQPALVAGAARVGFVAGAGIWYDDSAVVLAASATFTGTSRDLTVTATATAFANAATYAKELRVSAESDQTGTLWLEVSRDNVAWRRIKSVATTAVTGGGQYAEIIHQPSWRYARIGFTNGATLQTRFAIGSVAVAL